MKREQGVLPVVGKGGSIMNVDILQQIQNINRQRAAQLSKDFRIYEINTSEGETKDDPKRTAEVVAELVIGLIEEHIDEEILSYPRSLVTRTFADRNFISSDRAGQLLRHGDSDFMPRDQVEADTSRIQPIPIVVVRNASGEVLRLRRRERTSDNPLHNKVVLWAGGHVRREDAANGDPIIRCAIRELEEELRLQIRGSDLVPIGAVYFDNGRSTSKHVAIVYEWRAPTNDVSVRSQQIRVFREEGHVAQRKVRDRREARRGRKKKDAQGSVVGRTGS